MGDFWADNVLPISIGLLAALAHVADGGGAVTLLTGPALGWGLWQLALRLDWNETSQGRRLND